MRYLLCMFGLLLAVPVEAAPRNVVLVVADDLGQDLGCYGNRVIQTPHLDRFAQHEATRFKYAYATTASCSASRSVILTGMHNHANGHYGHEHSYHHFSAHDRLKSLPVFLTQAGYRTARIGKFHVASEKVFAFQEVLKGPTRNPVEMAMQCKEFLAAKSDKPFFLYFCTADPHRSGDKVGASQADAFGNKPKGYPGIKSIAYDPRDVIVPPFLPDTSACREELAQYYQSVSRLDQGFGRLVELLRETGHWDDTLVIFTSDHGIAFPGAKTTAYEPGLLVPLLLRHPQASRRGVVSSALVSHVDLAPTILNYANVSLPEQLQGQSYLNILAEDEPKGWDEIHASHTFHEITMYYPMRVVRSGKYKLIWNIAHPLPFPFASDLWSSSTWQSAAKQGPDTRYGQRSVKEYLHRPKFELYDLESDPHESKNLAADPAHLKTRQLLEAKLRQFQKRTNDPWLLKWDYE